MALFLLFVLASTGVFSQEIPSSMSGCQRHFASWARVEKVQLKAFKDAYPDSIWEGTLEERVTRFQAKWSNNVKIIDDVKFEFKSGGQVTSTSKKPMVIVSQKGLNEDQLMELTKDYTDAISWLTVSHPMSSGGGHLYTRLGNKTVDYFGWFSKDDYYLGTNRLEPLIELSPEEHFRLNTYVKNIEKNHSKVLGEEDYQGATNAVGTLTNNKPLQGCGGHNCTSWFGLAPVGEEQEMMVRLMGIGPGWNVHTNPGWWLQTLNGVAPKERVPYVFFFSDESIAQIKRKVKSDSVFKWDYGLH